MPKFVSLRVGPSVPAKILTRETILPTEKLFDIKKKLLSDKVGYLIQAICISATDSTNRVHQRLLGEKYVVLVLNGVPTDVYRSLNCTQKALERKKFTISTVSNNNQPGTPHFL